MADHGLTQGYFTLPDAGVIAFPMNNACTVLQTTTVNGRTAGHVYVYTADAWADIITLTASPTFTNLQLTELLTNAAAGGATSARKLLVKKTGIADASAAAIFTVSVPNANHAAMLSLTLLSSNGGAHAFESARVAKGLIAITRTAGVATVAVVATLALAQIATVASGATHTLAYSVSAMTGATSATQTFDVQVTIDDSTSTGSNQVLALAELVNSEASGVTIAAA